MKMLPVKMVEKYRQVSRLLLMLAVTPMICVTVGTGVGCGVILKGKVFGGALGTAGELGHVPVVYRGRPCSCGRRGCLERYVSGTAIYAQAMHIPGLKVACPSTPAEAAGLLRTAIRDDNPVIFFEHKALYATKGEVPDDPEFAIPFGKAAVKREGSDVTIVANLLYVSKALEAADLLEKEGIHADCDEYILFSSDGEVVIDGKTIPVKGNTVVRAQRGESHECRNTSHEAMYLYCVFSPALTPYGRYPQLIEKTKAFLKTRQP